MPDVEPKQPSKQVSTERKQASEAKPLSMTQPISKQEFAFQDRSHKNSHQESAYGDYNTVNPQGKGKGSPLNRTANATREEEYENNLARDLNSMNEAEPYRTTANEKNMNKTVKVVSAPKKFESSKLVSQGYQRPVAGPRNPRKAAMDASIERPRM